MNAYGCVRSGAGVEGRAQGQGLKAAFEGGVEKFVRGRGRGPRAEMELRGAQSGVMERARSRLCVERVVKCGTGPARNGSSRASQQGAERACASFGAPRQPGPDAAG